MQPMTATLSCSTPGYCLAPVGHGHADHVLDVLGQFLEGGGRGASAARAGGDDRHEGADAHGLQEFLRDLHLLGAVAARLRRQRDADRVADALLQQDAQRCGEEATMPLEPMPASVRPRCSA
jgi:hypothetical protein